MPVSRDGAQRASRHRSLRLIGMTVIAVSLALGGLSAQTATVAAAGKKVVIVVGPVGSQTADYIKSARQLAAQARSYGATVYEVYSPHATWAKVKSVAQGANLFIYLGHGNGYPSPYPWSTMSKDGLGLNTTDGSSSHTYYGEYYIARYLKFAPNSVVVLNRLCYASGNSEWGTGYPAKGTAIKRIDNYGAGFLRTGARAVYAEGVSNVGFVLSGLFKSSLTLRGIFWSDPAHRTRYAFSFASSRTPGKLAIVDPSSPGHYYKSMIGDVNMTAMTWRGG